MNRFQRIAVALILIVHAALLAWGAYLHSPAFDEVGHFAAGLYHWQTGRFELYRVNPPLVRLVATLPIALDFPKVNTTVGEFSDRMEFLVGPAIVRELGDRCQLLFAIARWACIPFSLLGAIVCFRWATQLYGTQAGLIALALWCFDPNILGNAQMITPDTGAAALGLLACYVFWLWLREPVWSLTALTGLILGLALLSKTTWIIAFGIFPLLWLIERSVQSSLRHSLRKELPQLALILALSVLVINLGYRFDGAFRQLGTFQFSSRTLTVEGSDNRFRETVLGYVPVPLPEQYILGIDQQKFDFESRCPSYLRGEWRRGGWWYYYLYAFAIKTPVGTLALLVFACWQVIRSPRNPGCLRMELLSVLPGLLLFAFVSTQTGFNHHFRYVEPALPFLFIWASRVGCFWQSRRAYYKSVVAFLIICSVVSSLRIYPHSLSYFNEVVGGPKNGHMHLLDSNIEWGQDLWILKDWTYRHPEASPLYIVNFGILDPRDLGIPAAGFPPSGFAPDRLDNDEESDAVVGPIPGWYAVGVAFLHIDDHPDRNAFVRKGVPLCGYFRHFKPVDRIGYSMNIYHLTPDEVSRVRRKLGLPAI